MGGCETDSACVIQQEGHQGVIDQLPTTNSKPPTDMQLPPVRAVGEKSYRQAENRSGKRDHGQHRHDVPTEGEVHVRLPENNA